MRAVVPPPGGGRSPREARRVGVNFDHPTPARRCRVSPTLPLQGRVGCGTVQAYAATTIAWRTYSVSGGEDVKFSSGLFAGLELAGDRRGGDAGLAHRLP